MRLLNIVLFLLFFVHATMSLTRGNSKGYHASRHKSGKDSNVNFNRPSKRFFPNQRVFPGYQIIQIKGRNLSLPLLSSANESKENLPWARESFKHYRRDYSSESIRDTSSTMELSEWKKNFEIDRLKLKKEAIIEKYNEAPHQEPTYMMAARPWTAPCGDANQHDWAWGSCTLAPQCDGEYRIYRGDIYCGRTGLVCCAVLYNTQDLYQGLDLSFENTDTDSSGEKRKQELGSVRLRRKKKHHDRARRWRRRKRAKRLIKKKIRKLVHHLRKMLNRAFRNATSYRKRKMQQLIKVIKGLKKKFQDERRVVIKKTQGAVEGINSDLTKKLLKLDSVNAHFLINETFREFLMRYNVSNKELRSLDMVNPKLLNYLRTRTGKLSEGILQLLAARRRNVTVDMENASIRLRYPLQPNVVRKLNDNEKSQYSSRDISASDNFVLNPNLNMLPRASMKAQNDPFWRIEVTKRSSTIKTKATNFTENPIDLENYGEMDNNMSEAVTDTRRAGRSSIFRRKKQRKRQKRKDYLEYDIEYGKLFS